ncbi:hypothetical protein RDABS01_012058, partial [Bienertia sinuspersici]
MFPFQKTGELSFQTMDFVAADEDQNNVENQFFWTDANASASTNSNNNYGFCLNVNDNTGPRRARGRGRGRRSSAAGGTSNNCNDDNNDEQKKKTIQREVERQRRLEMSNLYASLCSTLPPEYTQGKRSTSDQIVEAANYIKDLEKIDELKATNYDYQDGESSTPRLRQGSVVIEPRLGGISIDIDVGGEDESFGLSSALQIVFEEGLSVSSCTSTRVDERLVHHIICKSEMDIDFSTLHFGLIKIMGR